MPAAPGAEDRPGAARRHGCSHRRRRAGGDAAGGAALDFSRHRTRVVERRAGPLRARAGRWGRVPHGGDVRGFRAERASDREAYWVNELCSGGHPDDPRGSCGRAGSGTPRRSCRSSLTSSSTRHGCSSICSNSCAAPTPALSRLWGQLEGLTSVPGATTRSRRPCATYDDAANRARQLCRRLRWSAQPVREAIGASCKATPPTTPGAWSTCWRSPTFPISG